MKVTRLIKTTNITQYIRTDDDHLKYFYFTTHTRQRRDGTASTFIPFAGPERSS